MRHRMRGKTLARTASPRRALHRALVDALIQRSRITTTVSKAKALRPIVEKYITAAKKDSVAQRRQLLKSLSPVTVTKLLKEVGKKYAERKGGYTRIIKLSQRAGDGSQSAIIELV